MLFFYLVQHDKQLYMEQLKEKTFTVSQALKNRLQLDLNAIHVIKNFMVDSQSIKPNEVLLLANQTLFSFKELKFISWIKFTKK